MHGRKVILEKLLKLEVETGMELISIDELRYIDKLWEDEGDLSRRALVDMYSDIKGTKLPWDKYKKPLFDKEIISKIKAKSEEFDIPFELISKLIIEIEKNKNFSRTSILNKSFERVVNQGWLHHEAIKEGMSDYDN